MIYSNDRMGIRKFHRSEMAKRFVAAASVVAVLAAVPVMAYAAPASTHYQLQNYSIGGGGTTESSSSGYGLIGIIGQLDASGSSKNYGIPQGLLGSEQAAVPPAPTFTNPADTYDRLKIIIQTGGNASDTTYAIAISDDNWASVKYVQNDFTVGPVLGNEDRLTYEGWGGSSGKYITGLKPSTTYRVRVDAMTGYGTESAFGPESAAATGAPSLTFSIDSPTVTFETLAPENSFTDTSKHTVITTSTNAYNGYTVFAHESDRLSWGTHTINDYGSPNSAPTAWSGTGFGYTTSDSNLEGTVPDRFTAGGPKYAGFTTSAPGDPVADHIGPVTDTPISNEQFTVSYRVTASAAHAAGDYKNTLMYVVVPAY